MIKRVMRMGLVIGLASGAWACGPSPAAPPAGQQQPKTPAIRRPMTMPNQPSQAAPARPSVTPTSVGTKLSFDLFGRHKEYNQVTATVERNEQGQEQTVIRAKDGGDRLTLVVSGSGVGKHPLVRAEIKDQLLGDQPYVLDATDPNIAGSVTFTAFDPQGGRIEGSFDGGYTGFPSVRVSNGTLVAWHGSEMQAAMEGR